ncbi:MAG: hypothetical protein ACOC5T_10150 [Elusimicrobiota bacterium]
MSKIIWCWRKGNKKIYTKRIDIAKKAIEKGFTVTAMNNSSRVFGKQNFTIFCY